MRLPFLVLVLLAAGMPPIAAAPADCGPDATGEVRCEWTIRTQDQPTRVRHEFWFDAPPSSIATITVVLQGEDAGWSYTIFALPPGAERDRRVSEGHHNPDDVTHNGPHVDTAAHLLVGEPGTKYLLSFRTSHVAPGGTLVLPNAGVYPPSQGVFRITLHAQPVPEGTPPSRPAATREDPQLLDDPRDAFSEDMDLLAAWLDDERLDDGLFDVHVAVASLDHLDLNFSRQGVPVPGPAVAMWILSFRIEDQRYAMQWVAEAQGSGYDFRCRLVRYLDPGIETVIRPQCVMDVPNATLHARIPEVSVHTPAAGVPFTDLRAEAVHDNDLGYRSLEDEIRLERYPFALGGPDVWHGLNPRLDPPQALALPWYEAPLTEDNLPNTLQVVGAILASLTFLSGLVILAGRRRQTHRLLDRVDAIEAAAGFDSRETLLALGRLEEEFTRAYRRGRLTEAQYQIVSQRIASVATRFALRRQLGLDDGVPGEATLPGRRIPVMGPEAREPAPNTE